MFRLHLCQWQNFKLESQKLLKLAIPIFLAQLALTSLGFVDTVMSGQVGVNDLAAIGLGSSIMLPVFIFGTGILLAITPLVAKAEGAQQNYSIFLFQGLWIAIPIGLLSLLLLMNLQWLLNLLDLNTSVYQLTEDYLYYIAFGMPGIALYQVLKFYWEGLGHTLPTMWISFFALLLNIPLNYLFIYGYGPIDAMGAAGCGVASSVVMWAMFGIGLFTVHKLHLVKFSRELQQSLLPKWSAGLGQISKLGIPNALAMLFEVTLFTFITLFIASLGAKVIAGQQIAISFTSLLFMLPLSLGMAVTVRVGSTYGKKDQQAILTAMRTALIVAVLTGFVLAISTYVFKESIVSWYTDDAEVMVIAVSILILASLYQWFDAVQVIAAGCLRGFHDTKITMWVTLFSYWGLGLGLGYVLSFTDWIVPAMGVTGFWLGIVFGLGLAAILLSWRLQVIHRAVVKEISV